MGNGKKKERKMTDLEVCQVIISLARIVVSEGGGDIKFIPEKPPWKKHE